jgi:hypothetical protein
MRVSCTCQRTRPAAGKETDNEIFRLIRDGFHAEVRPGYKNHFPQKIPISAAARDLIARLLDPNPARRPTAQEALEDPWFLGGIACVLPPCAPSMAD